MSNRTKGQVTPYLINTVNGVKRFRTKKRFTDHEVSLRYRWARYMHIGLMYNKGISPRVIGLRFNVGAGVIRNELKSINWKLAAFKHLEFEKGSEK